MNWNNWLYADRLGEEKQTPKPQTNADRIRAMSDEELADLMATICDCVRCPAKRMCIKSKSCRECLLEYLRKPVTE